MNIPKNLRYTASHEWVREETDGTLTVGITDHAQCLLGDVVFVELPPLKKHIEAGKEASVVESVKAAADVYSPVSGEVIATNPALNDNPALINTSPYQEGWIFQIRPENNTVNALMDADAYAATT
ncbi:MAG: glycine cleavage system protein GcvH [Gammaproteobacteria bacterium]|nr:glycine cleavage system protein GcvH [Gammaproteobacteria bacterium]